MYPLDLLHRRKVHGGDSKNSITICEQIANCWLKEPYKKYIGTFCCWKVVNINDKFLLVFGVFHDTNSDIKQLFSRQVHVVIGSKWTYDSHQIVRSMISRAQSYASALVFHHHLTETELSVIQNLFEPPWHIIWMRSSSDFLKFFLLL